MNEENRFKIVSPYQPQGDQPQAIEALCEGLLNGEKNQVLLGVTGSGKTYTMANVIERMQRPTLVLAHNKTLAAQLCSEFKEFFPDSTVELFISYYDYYQPEAYIPSSDIYIEKVATVNDEIDKLRHSATSALQERRDVIIVASVSCIYALGDPEEYLKLSLSLRPGMQHSRNEVIRRLVEIQYERNDIDFSRGTFRARGDTLEIFPASSSEKAVRVEFFGDEIDRICEIDTTSGHVMAQRNHIAIFPASHYASSQEKVLAALDEIEQDMRISEQAFLDQEKHVEAQRIRERTLYDIEMMREIGYCSGVENYSRYFDGRKPGDPPYTLLDYFPDDFLLFIDESHVTIPQVRGMYRGDLARKTSLVEHGFRVPSAFDNRPLRFDEFEARIGQTIFVSATPGSYEQENSGQLVEQIIRPTGLVDPVIEVKPAQYQVDDVLEQVHQTVQKGFRVLVTTLTKRMSESLTQYMQEQGVRVRYMHSEIEALERMEIIRDLRLGEFDVLIGINLLREGLDLPEVALVAILDADKEGFLRSTQSLVQTIGRAARNVEGRVIMYAQTVTDSMRRAIDETDRRRKKQMDYNTAHDITPQSIVKSVRDIIEATKSSQKRQETLKGLDPEKTAAQIALLQEDMQKAAQELDFELAAKLRDKIFALQGKKALPASQKSRPEKRGRRY
ncbi:MAG: excinuclease ABC subunit UvrB [Christensenellales bacterium]|jgi:excinuclease ABC subunit B